MGQACHPPGTLGFLDWGSMSKATGLHRLQAQRGLTAACIREAAASGYGTSMPSAWHMPHWADERRGWGCGQWRDSKSRLGFPRLLVKHLKLPHP